MLHRRKSFWEIQENAVQALSSSELSLLYGLFTLYDSSITGDRLPCLHLSRFMKIVQDAGLFTHNFTIKDAKEIFANAIHIHLICFSVFFLIFIMISRSCLFLNRQHTNQSTLCVLLSVSLICAINSITEKGDT